MDAMYELPDGAVPTDDKRLSVVAQTAQRLVGRDGGHDSRHPLLRGGGGLHEVGGLGPKLHSNRKSDGVAAARCAHVGVGDNVLDGVVRCDLAH